MSIALPAAKSVRDLLESLFGRPVETAPGRPVPVTLDDPAVVGVYVDDSLQMVAVMVLDVPLAAACGAALALLPPQQAKISAEAKALTDNLADNVGEVLNIAVGLLGGGEGSHVRLHRVHQPDERLPNDVASLASTFGNRLDVEIEVGGYGGGTMSVVATA